jgi:hypothetical protein
MRRKGGAQKQTAPSNAPPFAVDILTEGNSRLRRSVVHFLHVETNAVLHADKVDLDDATKRKALCQRAAQKLGAPCESVEAKVEAAYLENLDKHRHQARQAAAGAPDVAAVETVELLDTQPHAIRRPLCLIAGRAYAAAWCQIRRVTTQGASAPAGQPATVERTEDHLAIVRDDGIGFGGGGAPGFRPIAELPLPVCLPLTPRPGRGWSGAGVRRYLAGERPDPVAVFAQLKAVVDHFIDFARSLDDQDVMCELVACYIVATYFLDAFHVIGYLWPNGEAGAGKTSLLQVVTETGFLGELLLGNSTLPTLRDLADYGACLGFDDAEAVMDTKRTDPDKRTLLLAGNRRGACIAYKELQGDAWVTRYVSTFCPRLFSAIRLPDPVLGSRSIIVPLVKSGDQERTKRNVMAPEDWPPGIARQPLIDDLWAVGLAGLPELPDYDRRAAQLATLAGRNLEPWRAVLAVALWLEERHQVRGLFERMEKLSMDYQGERAEYEDHDKTRILYRALLELTAEAGPEGVSLTPSTIAAAMKRIAQEEELGKEDEPFATPQTVGWAMKRQRFKRPPQRNRKGKEWVVTRAEVEQAARAHGIEPSPPAPVQERPHPQEEDDTPF